MNDAAPQSSEEKLRLQALHDAHVLDSEPDETLDKLTRLAGQICGTPITLISLIDDHRQWFLSNQGLAVTETPRDQAFCDVAIRDKDRLMEVPDARQDPRFANNPLVTGEPKIGFYAGVPLVTADGHALGTLCVIDHVPRQLSPEQRDALTALAYQAVRHIEMRTQLHRLAASIDGTRHLAGNESARNSELAPRLFRSKMYFGFGSALLLMLMLATVGYRVSVEARASAWRVSQTHEVIGQIETLHRQMTDLETGARGYFASGADVFLTPYEDAIREIPATLSALETMISDNTTQLSKVAAAKALIADEQAALSEAVGVRRSAQQVPLPLLLKGKVAMDQFRAVIADMQAIEERLLVTRAAQSSLDNRWSAWTLVIAVLLALATMIWLFRNVLRESSERAAIAAQLQRAGALHSAILDSTNLSVIAVDLDGKITTFNRAAEAMLRYRADEVLGRYTPAIFHEPAEVAAHAAVLSARLGAPVSVGMETFMAVPLRGGVDEAEWTYIRKDGRRVAVRLSTSALRDPQNEITGFLGVAADITQRKRDLEALRCAKEDAEEAARVKTAFLATMSHEIRTPMNGVMGMTSLLLDTPLSPEQRDFTEVIRVSGESLLVVINDILDYSRIESGKMYFDNQPFDLQDAVESTIELLALKAQDKRLDLVYLIEPDVPRWIYGDMPRLRQILVNLVSNAVKFTEHGEVFINVKRTEINRPAREMPASDDVLALEFSVRDTGMGIPADKIDLLFSAFTQVDSSIARRFGGSGLGLAISKRLVEGMGGEMRVKSRAGEGATFSFSLPTAAAAALTPIEEISHFALDGKRVLLVDDNATNLRILGLQVESWGLLHDSVSEPRVAIDMAVNAAHAGRKFDLVITDMHMPVLSGIDVAKQIHRVRPELPIILLSSINVRQSEHAANFVATLTKPARQSALLDAVVRALHLAMPSAGVAQRPNAPIFDHTLAERYPLHILLAEDNDINQKLALRVLKSFGYLADVAANGWEVLAAVKRQHYDLILMDIQMPEMDGLEASRRIIEMWPDENRRPRVIAMSANAMREDLDIAAEAGMDDYVTKPIAIPALHAALERCGKRKLDLAERIKEHGVATPPPSRA